MDNVHCVNFDEAYNSSSRSCSHWQHEKKVLTLKVKESLTYIATKKLVDFGKAALPRRREEGKGGGAFSKASKEVQVGPNYFAAPPFPLQHQQATASRTLSRVSNDISRYSTDPNDEAEFTKFLIRRNKRNCQNSFGSNCTITSTSLSRQHLSQCYPLLDML